MGDIPLIPSEQIRDPAACSRPRGNSTAVCGKSADSGLCMQRDQIAEEQCPVQLLFVRIQSFRIDDHRKRYGQSLVSAARTDDHRQFAAVHPCIRTGCSICLGAVLQIIACFQKYFPDIGAVIIFQPILRDRSIAFDLAVEDLPDIFQIARTRKVIDIMHRKQGIIRDIFLAFIRFRILFLKHLSVFFNEDDLRMLIGNTDLRIGCTAKYSDDHIKYVIRLQRHDFDRRLFEIGSQTLLRLLADTRDDFQFSVFIAAEHSDPGSCRDAPSSACVGNDNAFDVFDDIAACFHGDFLRERSKRCTRSGGTVGQSDRFRAPHRADQFTLQDIDIGTINRIISVHITPPFHIFSGIFWADCSGAVH